MYHTVTPGPMLAGFHVLNAWTMFFVLFSLGRMSLFSVCWLAPDCPQRFPLPKKRIGERRATWTLTGASCHLSPVSTSSARPCPATAVEKMPPMFTRGTPLYSPRIIFPPASPDSVRPYTRAPRFFRDFTLSATYQKAR